MRRTRKDIGEDRIDLLSSWIIENALVRERRKPGFAAPDFCTGHRLEKIDVAVKCGSRDIRCGQLRDECPLLR